MGYVIHDYLGLVVAVMAAILSTHGIRTGYITWVLWRGSKTPHELIVVATLVLTYAFSGGYFVPPKEQAQRSIRIDRVIDGDTVLSAGHRIRLADIDAPEKGQPWGRQATECLAHLVGHKWLTLETKEKDLYGRTVGKLYLLQDGQKIDINRLLVLKGCAWAYGSTYAAEEAQARAARRGLWAQDNPLPPSEWRRRRKSR